MSRSSNPMDNFEYLRAIGKGSYGEVSLYRHKRDRKQYVLKRINLAKASKKERSSAEQEAKLLSKLKHPNIVAYKDSFERDGQLHIAMQFCEGGDVYTKLKEQKQTLLEERQVVEWFVQIAMALQYMHERNILHRDLKTQNIFLTKSKIIKVGDLGIARVLDSSTDMATTLIGTPYYMSPELFSNKPYNHKSHTECALKSRPYLISILSFKFVKSVSILFSKFLTATMAVLSRITNVQIPINQLFLYKGHQSLLVEPVPAPLRKQHARKPSNGANKELPPIAEVAKPVEVKKKLDSSSESSDNDTLVEVHPVKEVNDVESALREEDKDCESALKKRVVGKNIFKNPKKVDNPRPLPPPPKQHHGSGEPQKRPSFSQEKQSNGSKSSSTGTSSSKEEDLDINTPRSCNLSARERRREKDKAAQSLERPVSARSVVLKPVRHVESNKETKAEKNQREQAHPRVQVVARHKRIPSMKDDSSSSEEETMKESSEFKREHKRENKEMNNFITLLDTTLHMNREDDKSDDEEDKKEPVPPAHDIHRSASLPSVETLCNADRLTSRIQLLHKDCVDGVGFEVLHKSFTILSNIEEDEVEPQLIQLMGKEKFDIYAGKIWQLKFCEECFEQLSFLPR
ncbi:NIMA (never in mitosis gene a)-related kinase [Mytilus galloprovincialis]|uniref:non-specific serine/threonine protein kinase n=1 Tax=Mytilus galloprovincialis TaxID=29158 RepID=A0A8B6EMF9_MYTGA|nr:NIMA (never in mitosis gene a)-related kinase [Mytilus galloprovincialis]